MRHTRTIRLTETEEKVIQAAAALVEVGTSVFLRAAGLAAAKEVMAAGCADSSTDHESRIEYRGQQ